MTWNTNKHGIDDPASIRLLRNLIIGRLALVVVLLLATWWWVNSYLGLSIEGFPNGLFLLFVFSSVLSIVYYFLSKTRRDLAWQIRGQLLIDVVLISWLVAQTGEIFSPFITLYILLICLAGLMLGRSDTLLIAGFAAVSFLIVSFAASQSFYLGASDNEPVSRFIQSIAFNIVGILIVGLLAARLSERRRIFDRLKHTEQSFADLHLLHERIVESIGTGIITTDLNGCVFSINLAAQRLIGVDPKDAIGQHIGSLMKQKGRSEIESYLSRISAARSLPIHFETKFDRGVASHESVLVACTAVPLLLKDGSDSGLILTLQDITKIRELEESIRRSDRLAAVGRMAAGLAHEIRNPLGSMSSALQYLSEKAAPKSEENLLMNVVLRESDRLNQIISNFLAYAKPGSTGKTRKGNESSDAVSALRDCLALLEHSPEVSQSHEITVEIPDGPVNVMLGETEMKQVIWNLARNALAAMPEAGRLLTVLSCDDNGFAEIKVVDSGSGIPSNIAQHLFEPFVEGSRGSGLGLSIVHRIISDVGGDIRAYNDREQGTVFLVRIPLAESFTESANTSFEPVH